MKKKKKIKGGGRLYRKLQGGGQLGARTGLLASQRLLETEQTEPEVGTRAAGLGLQRGAQAFQATGSPEIAAGFALAGAVEGGLGAAADKEKMEYERGIRRDQEKFLKEQSDTAALFTYPTKGLEGATMYARMGGKIPAKNDLLDEKVEGGKLTKINDSTVKVKANNPKKTDSVRIPSIGVALDNGETVKQEGVGYFVYSDDSGHADKHEKIAKKKAKIEDRLKAGISNKAKGEYESLLEEEENLKMNQEMAKKKKASKNYLYTKMNVGGGLVPGQELYGGINPTTTATAPNMIAPPTGAAGGNPAQAAMLGYEIASNIGDSLAYTGKDARTRREKYKPINPSLIQGQGVTLARKGGGSIYKTMANGGELDPNQLSLTDRKGISDLITLRDPSKDEFTPTGTGETYNKTLADDLGQAGFTPDQYLSYLEGVGHDVGGRGFGADDPRNLQQKASSYRPADAPAPSIEDITLEERPLTYPTFEAEEFTPELGTTPEGQDVLNLRGDRGLDTTIGLVDEPIAEVDIERDIQPETVEPTRDGRYRVKGLDGSWRYIDNIHASKLIREREREEIPQRGLEQYVSPQYANLDPLRRNVEDRVAKSRLGTAQSNLSTAAKQAQLANNLATEIGLDNTIASQEEELNRRESIRVDQLNRGVDRRNLASQYLNVSDRFKARDEIRRDRQRNVRDITEDTGEIIKDTKAETLIQDQNLVNLTLDDPRKVELALNNMPDDVFYRATGTTKSEWRTLSSGERKERVRLSETKQTNFNKGGKLYKKMGY